MNKATTSAEFQRYPMQASKREGICLLKTVGDSTIRNYRRRSYVNLDNAATTPAAADVWEAVNAAIHCYGSVHRGSGMKSVVSTALFEQAKLRIKRFVGADTDDVLAIACNSTIAINRFANNYEFEPHDIVLVSEMEHSSNDLPWRNHASVIRVASLPSGGMDLNDLEAALKKHGRNVRLVAVTGASNVNGFLTPLKEIARLSHRHGAEVFVDAAQLAAHRQIRMRTGTDAEIDYVAFSGHKMYAPFGVGVVIGRKSAFLREPPDLPGGGTVEMLTADDQIWASLPARINPGSPNLVGLVAVAAAAELIESIGFDKIQAHERLLVRKGFEMFSAIPEVVVHGQSMFSADDDRLPIFPFTVRGIPFGKIAAILGHEYGIAVRQGHLCQYEFMRRELGVTQDAQSRIEEDIRNGDKTSRYGMVRASCGLCTSEDDLDALGEALRAIISGNVSLEYFQDRGSGEFRPKSGGNDVGDLIPLALSFLFKST